MGRTEANERSLTNSVPLRGLTSFAPLGLDPILNVAVIQGFRKASTPGY
jgi:hypothetical protein